MCDLLLSLLAIGDPMQVSERDIKMAIDIAASTMKPFETFEIKNTDEGTTEGLLRLLNSHPKLLASFSGQAITVTFVNEKLPRRKTE